MDKHDVVAHALMCVFICNPEQALFDQLVAETIAAELEHELELDMEREQELVNEVPIEVEPEVVPWMALSDWDFYVEMTT